MAMNTQTDSMPISQQFQPTEDVAQQACCVSSMRWGLISVLLFLVGAIWGCTTPQHLPMKQAYELEKPVCERIITADVVALDQVYFYNRFGSFNPAGIMYALRRDVVTSGDGQAGEPDVLNGDLDNNSDDEGKPIPLKPSAADLALAGNVKLRSDKRPRPLVLRANEGDCLHVTFTNLLSPIVGGQEMLNDPELRLTHPEAVFKKDGEGRGLMDGDEPATRHASMHVNGLSLVNNINSHGVDVGIESQGVNVGINGWKGQDGKCSVNRSDFGKDLCVLAAPGETRTYTWYAKKEGTYFFYSMGAPAGGEGDGGQIGLGLFGAVNVQPKGAIWYRSQVTNEDLKASRDKKREEDIKQTGESYGQPVINYRATYQNKSVSDPRKDDPILNMLKCSTQEVSGPRALCEKGGEIVHSDLNAVIDIEREEDCEEQGEGNACGKPYREFTVIFHDEITAVQAFRELDSEESGLSSLRDGMGINYGASGLGPMVIANRQKIGPAKECAECKLEEFFLTSWVNGDPAMVVGYEKGDAGQLVKRAKYPDDPSNVHHSYLGDPIRFRNMHAGPKETHVFHLHAHQWVEDKHDASSHYLDSQTISPGSTFSYEVHYGGSGNRNLGPGDSIFHCHLYPHFAQGMWELWRTHDVFEDGTIGLFDPQKKIGKDNDPRWRNLPDAEITEGIPNPAVVPLPRTPLPPMPSEQFAGYPFYIKAEVGHRPPQPPLDLESDRHASAKPTLRRHMIVGKAGKVKDGADAEEPKHIINDVLAGKLSEIPLRVSELHEAGKQLSDYTARRVFRDNQNLEFFGLARQLESVQIQNLAEAGEPQEKIAMQFHAGTLNLGSHGKAHGPSTAGWTHTPYNWEAPGYPTCLSDGTCDDEKGARVLFRVNGGGNIGMHVVRSTQNGHPGEGVPGAPFSNPCPKQYVAEDGRVSSVNTRKYRAAYIQMDMTVNKAGWHDPQARFPVLEEDVRATLDGSRPTEPLFFRANSGECVEFYATNLIPSNLNLDDFQVYSPTDTIGQHIHLVKFDVTSSDGSGNGWNYEDGTFAADEVRERIVAYNRYLIETSMGDKMPRLLEPKTHRIFLKGGPLYNDSIDRPDPRGVCPPSPPPNPKNKEAWIKSWEDWGKEAVEKHPWCGAQTTIQRWWADPVLNGKPGGKDVKDRTLRTVFTHDHFGPSSHQHHGFYAALVVEPSNSKWTFLNGRDMGGVDDKGTAMRVQDPLTNKERHDGGPTSYAANIIVREGGKACLNSETTECSRQLDHQGSIDRLRTGREFNLAFADFAIVYTSDLKSDLRENEPGSNRLRPVNPPSHNEGGVLNPVIASRIPLPEGISTNDPGTQLVNYRNEPIPLRIGEWKQFDSSTIVPSPWSCLSVVGAPGTSKKSCYVQKDQEIEVNQKKLNVGDMAHVFSSKFDRDLDRKGASIFTECLLGVCPKDFQRNQMEREKTMVANETDRIGRQKGDPATPLIQAYDGDRVQIRLIQGAQEEQHVFNMHGARWLTQPDSQNSGYVNAQHIGISEHFEFNDRMLGLSELPSGALGHGIEAIPCKKPCRTDLLFSSSAMDNLWDGQWGLMRVYPAEENNVSLNRILARLPGNTDKNPFADALSAPGLDERLDSEAEPSAVKNEKRSVHDPVEAFCKDPARKEFLKTFRVEAKMAKDIVGEKGLMYNETFGIADPDAIVFVEQHDVSAIQRGKRGLEPLILRARAGDCIEVILANKLPKEMPDDHRFLMDAGPIDNMKFQQWQRTWSYNMVTPIIEGFNFNQVRSSNRVGLHAGLVDQNSRRSDGAHVGLNEDSTVEPGESRTYLWYAGDLTGRKGGIRARPIEFGVIPLTDEADVIKHPAHGAIGALVIEPQCSEFKVEKVTDRHGEKESNAVATVTWWEPVRETARNGKHMKASWCPQKPNDRASMSTTQKRINTILSPSSWMKTDGEHFGGVNRFKEFVLLYQDALALQQYGQPLPNLRNGDDAEDSGHKGFNYRTEPLWARLGASAADEPDVMNEYDWSNVLSSNVVHAGCLTVPCDPETPIFEVDAGEPIRFRVVHPGGHPRQHALAIFGHNWSDSPWTHRSSVMAWNEDSPTRFGTTNGVGPARHLNIQTRAGGDCAVPGDYLYRTQEGFMFGGGLWGILRVNKPEDPTWWRLGINPQNLVKQDETACKVLLSTTQK